MGIWRLSFVICRLARRREWPVVPMTMAFLCSAHSAAIAGVALCGAEINDHVAPAR